jgi:hypothetical protein
VASPRVRRSSARIQARDVSDLAAMIVGAIDSKAVTEIDVRVESHRVPKGWIGRPGIAGVRRQHFEIDGQGVRVRLTVEPERDIAVLAAAALRMISPVRGPRCTVAGALPESAATLAPAVCDVLGEDLHAHLRRADIFVSGSAGLPDDQFQTRVEPLASGQWLVNQKTTHVWVDPAVHRPIGRSSVMDLVTSKAPKSDWLTNTQVNALKDITVIDGVVSDPVRAQLHACGVLLADELPTAPDALALQALSVDMRRRALRAYTWPAALDQWPTVSAIMLTNRAEHLRQICSAMGRFDYPHLQIVIGLHGDVQDSGVIQEVLADRNVAVVRIGGDVPFGAAMQRACDAADGQLLTKVDDDDIYGSQHIWDLVLAKMYSGAEIVGKALDWIYLADEDTTIFRPVYSAERYAKFVAGGTIMIDAAALASVGGWRPVPRSIDRALLDSVRLAGGLVYRTHGLGYIYVRRANGHTAQVDNAHFRTRAQHTWDGRISHPEFA